MANASTPFHRAGPPRPGRHDRADGEQSAVFDKENRDGLRRAPQIPALAQGWKKTFEKRLTKKAK